MRSTAGAWRTQRARSAGCALAAWSEACGSHMQRGRYSTLQCWVRCVATTAAATLRPQLQQQSAGRGLAGYDLCACTCRLASVYVSVWTCVCLWYGSVVLCVYASSPSSHGRGAVGRQCTCGCECSSVPLYILMDAQPQTLAARGCPPSCTHECPGSRFVCFVVRQTWMLLEAALRVPACDCTHLRQQPKTAAAVAAPEP